MFWNVLSLLLKQFGNRCMKMFLHIQNNWTLYVSKCWSNLQYCTEYASSFTFVYEFHKKNTTLFGDSKNIQKKKSSMSPTSFLFFPFADISLQKLWVLSFSGCRKVITMIASRGLIGFVQRFYGLLVMFLQFQQQLLQAGCCKRGE